MPLTRRHDERFEVAVHGLALLAGKRGGGHQQECRRRVNESAHAASY
jgi:hypothetical protein